MEVADVCAEDFDSFSLSLDAFVKIVYETGLGGGYVLVISFFLRTYWKDFSHRASIYFLKSSNGSM